MIAKCLILEGRGEVLQVEEEARDHDADGAQVRARLLQAVGVGGIRGEVKLNVIIVELLSIYDDYSMITF